VKILQNGFKISHCSEKLKRPVQLVNLFSVQTTSSRNKPRINQWWLQHQQQKSFSELWLVEELLIFFFYWHAKQGYDVDTLT